MSTKRPSDEEQLRAVLDAIADSIERAPAEELLDDERHDGRDPAQTAGAVTALLREAVSRFQREHREHLRASYKERVIKVRAHRYRAGGSVQGKRALLMRVLTQRPEYQGMLTAQHRDFESLPEEDVDSYLDELVALGVLEVPDDSDRT